MSPTFVTYPTWKEMFGQRPTDAQIVEEISSLNAFHSIWFLARINLLLALDRFHSSDEQTIKIQTFLVNILIDEPMFTRLRGRFGREQITRRRPFHPAQVLMLPDSSPNMA